MPITQSYPEFNNCTIRFENFVPGEIIRLATDKMGLSGEEASNAPTIWSCSVGDEKGCLKIQWTVVGREWTVPIGLSLFSAQGDVLSLQVAGEDIAATSDVKHTEAISPLFSLIHVDTFLSAVSGTAQATLYFLSSYEATASVELCGQRALLSNNRWQATYDWVFNDRDKR